jgi:LuxR family maltose regulon positive regulatory protein
MPTIHLVKVKVLLARGTPADVVLASNLLDAMNTVAEHTRNTRYALMVRAHRALALDALGQADAALEALKQALTLARVGGFIEVFVELGPPMRRLMTRLRQHSVSTEVLGRILSAFPDEHSGRHEHLHPGDTLTRRELEILWLMRDRLSDKEIADRLKVAPSTVKSHANTLYGKLGVRKRRDAVTKAKSLGILPQD